MNETNKAENVIMALLSFKQQLAWERLKKESWEIEMSHCKIHIDTVHDHDQGSYSLLLDWEGRERVKTYED